MAARIQFVIAGIDPPEVRGRSAEDRKVFWGFVRDFTLVRKDWELSIGLNARGKKMPLVYPETRLNRRSAMGRPDPYGPYLQPARKKSRTRALLVGEGLATRAVFTWSFDPVSGDKWSKILAYHRARGEQYDVIGISLKGRAWVAAKAIERWREWDKGKKGPASAMAAGGPSKKAAMWPGSKPTTLAEPALKKAPPPPPPGLPASLDGLKVVRELGGSTGAQLVEDAAGNRFVLKRGASPGHLKSEAAADAMYRAAGLDVPDSVVVKDGSGNPVKVARYVEGRTLGELKQSDPKAYKAAVAKLRKGFAADALVGNWDVVGLDLDNVVVDAAGKVHRVDNGGSLTYRAQGSKKSGEQFGRWNVGELASMRDPAVNPSAAGVFAGLSDTSVAAQVQGIVEARRAIVKAAPAGLRKVVSARIDALERFAASRGQGWKPSPAGEFAGRSDKTAEAEAWMTKAYGGWTEALDSEQRAAVRGYTNQGYRSLNAMLRGEDPAKIVQVGRVKLLDDALASRPLPEGRVVYRGFRDHRAVLKAMGVKRPEDIKPGMDYIDPAYKSTSAAREAAFDSTEPGKSLLLEIRLPKGTHAAGVQAASDAPHEIELLVGRDTDVFRVVKVRKDGTIVVEGLRSADLLKREGTERP